MVILPATEADLQAVIELVAQGRAALARQGVDQWQDGYPSPETIRRDLLRGDGRIVRIDGAAAAYAAFVFDGELFWGGDRVFLLRERLDEKGVTRRRGSN